MRPAIALLDPAWFRRAAEHQARLTMPAGAMGRLLDLGRQLCAIQETLQPHAEPAAVLLMAADHGIAAEGVSAYPAEVTGQMVANFLRGGAAINVLARRQKAQVLVVDMGIKEPRPLGSAGCAASRGRLGKHSVARGTANFLHGPAMSEQQAIQAIAAGRQAIADHLPENRVIILGEMGIGNTTSASALTAVLTGQEAAAVTGRGTGVNDAQWRHKVDVVEQALRRHFPSGRIAEPLEALMALGGFEIAGMVGAALEAAARRMTVLLDGFISSVAGLLAARIDPAARDYFIAGHRGLEAGHRIVLEALELHPLLDLGMRLGEGSGAALALNLVQCAADIMRDMATFDEAGVDRLLLEHSG